MNTTCTENCIKCLGFSFYISLLLNLQSRNFLSPSSLPAIFQYRLYLSLSNVQCLSWHLKVVLVQHGKWSLFIQVHCPDLCPPIYLFFCFVFPLLSSIVVPVISLPTSFIDLLINKFYMPFISV